MTGQSLLDYMGDLDRELATGSGGLDVDRALRALNAAQDYFESLAGRTSGIIGSHSDTITTTPNSETTAFPTDVIRIDAIWRLNDDSLPVQELFTVDTPGGHLSINPVGRPPWTTFNPSGASPDGYWTNGRLIYWSPGVPDGVYTLRWYGFQRQTDITTDGTFLYDDGVALPLAIFAVEIMRRGLDDPISDYLELANQTFNPQIELMKRFQRTRAPSRHYTRHHDT